MNNILVIVILIIIICILTYNNLEYFQTNGHNAFKDDIIISISGLLNISPRRIHNLNYTFDSQNNADLIRNVNLDFDILPRNEQESNEKNIDDVINTIEDLIVMDAFLISINNNVLLIKNTNIGEQTERFEDNNGEVNKYTDTDTLDKHIKYINKDIKRGSPSNNNLERYFRIDHKSNTLKDPEPLIIPEEENISNS